ALRLELLGPVQFAGEPVRGRKRQELLALLLEARVAGRGEVGKLELLDALYPGEDEEKAASSLKELVRTVRTSLGPSAVTTTPGGYALGDAVGSDLEEFLRTGDTRLWRGAYLEGLSSSNETVRESVHLALRARAGALLEADPKEAARLGRLLLEADPYDLEALRLTLEALRRAGNHRSLSRLYEEARARMLEVGERLPGDWQDFLA
ncbi:AfsR/SARP family transcriptional regulator, partial [Calidithermus chliarophilus]|uniref:AfsR/SARP family transcriptional regulator n=1 Tax=Calidithermus chliarophilus TaxID=52023 RepID=UPI00048781C3